jgi:hypothetical protein
MWAIAVCAIPDCQYGGEAAGIDTGGYRWNKRTIANLTAIAIGEPRARLKESVRHLLAMPP